MLVEKETELLYLREIYEESQKRLTDTTIEKEGLEQWKDINTQKIQLIEKEVKECREMMEVQKVELDKESSQNTEYLKKIRDQENIMIEDKDKIDNFLESMKTKKMIEGNLSRISEKQ